MSSDQTPNNPDFEPENPAQAERAETWAALLARWTAFARAAVALPETPDAERWRRAVVPIITLQAVVHALGEVHLLAEGERGVAVDRAGVLVREHAAGLVRAWGNEALPESLLDLVGDARAAHAAAAAMGAHWLVEGSEFVMPTLEGMVGSLAASGFGGDVLAALPGTILFRGEPAVFVRPAVGVAISGLVRAERDAAPMQVYRQADPETGAVSRDVVAPLLTGLAAGRPMLVPVMEGGEVVLDLSAHDAGGWEAQQRRAIGERVVGVEWEAGGA